MKTMLLTANTKLLALYWCVFLLLLKPWQEKHSVLRGHLWMIIVHYTPCFADESDLNDIEMAFTAAKVRSWELPYERQNLPNDFVQN